VKKINALTALINTVLIKSANKIGEHSWCHPSYDAGL